MKLKRVEMSLAPFHRRETTSSGLSYGGYLNGNSGKSGFRPPRQRKLTIHRLSSTKATLVAIGCTLSDVFDVPVYWPILVVYFFVLFALTMRRQIRYAVQFSSL
jgi:Rer1 family